MSKLRSIGNFLKFFAKDLFEDFREMDHRLIRIAVTLGSFALMAFFWLYFFKSSTPFG